LNPASSVFYIYQFSQEFIIISQLYIFISHIPIISLLPPAQSAALENELFILSLNLRVEIYTLCYKSSRVYCFINDRLRSTFVAIQIILFLFLLGI